MLNIMKNIARRYWIFLLMMLLFGILSFLAVEDRAAVVVLIYIVFLAVITTDLKSIVFECSLPIDRKKVVDARFLFILLLLSMTMVIFTPKAMKYGNLPRFASVLALSFLGTAIWMTYAFCFGRGDGIKNLVMGILMTVLVFLIIYVNVGNSLLVDTMENAAAFFLMVSGIAVYCILWIVSRKRIGKADI